MPASRHYRRVAARAGHRCGYCLAPEALFTKEFEVEHVVPRARGGATVLGNLALACRACNGAKGARLAALPPGRGAPVWLFNPRVDAWDEHVAIDLATGVVHPRTAKGAATVEALKLNALKQVVARQLWIANRLFP